MNVSSGNILTEIVQNRRLIRSLAKNDFKTKFAGSYLGTIWAFVQPVVTVLIYWFVFDKAIGMRVSIRSELPLPMYCGWWQALCPGFSFQTVSVPEHPYWWSIIIW